MKVLRFLFLALLIVLTVCVYRLAEDGTDDQIESPTVDYLTNRIFSLNTPIASVSLPEEVGENFNALTEGHIDHVLNEINPANDWLLNVNDARRKSILEDPSSFGISNVDELPELGMIRFSISTLFRLSLCSMNILKWADSVLIILSTNRPGLQEAN